MKLFKSASLLGIILAAGLAVRAEEVKTAKPAPKPDLLKTCPVSGEKLGEMGKPVVFTWQDQEVKLCCNGCKKEFDKTPEKFMKKIRTADKKADIKADIKADAKTDVKTAAKTDAKTTKPEKTEPAEKKSPPAAK